MNWLEIFNGLLTPVIACIAVYIAWQQHKTTRNKLPLDLYEKRYKIYESIKKFILGIIDNPDGLINNILTVL